MSIRDLMASRCCGGRTLITRLIFCLHLRSMNIAFLIQGTGVLCILFLFCTDNRSYCLSAMEESILLECRNTKLTTLGTTTEDMLYRHKRNLDDLYIDASKYIQSGKRIKEENVSKIIDVWLQLFHLIVVSHSYTASSISHCAQSFASKILDDTQSTWHSFINHISVCCNTAGYNRYDPSKRPRTTILRCGWSAWVGVWFRFLHWPFLFPIGTTKKKLIHWCEVWEETQHVDTLWIHW